MIRELLYEALQAKSPEIQTMGLFLVKKLYHLFEASPAEANAINVVTKWNIKFERDITGEFSRIYLKLPDRKPLKERVDELFTREGKIAQDKLAPFFGILTPLKVEVIGLREGLEAIAIKNEDTTITKNKKVIRLPHFKSTPWHDVTIRFLDERNVHIQGGTKTAVADYEALGFSDDKSKKPNLAWTFLLGMAKNNGETEKIESPVPDNVKQLKRQISDFFKKLFKNDTEPFYDFSETNTYKLRIKLIPPQTEEAPAEDRFGLKSYLDETMTSEYETPKSDDER